MKYTHIAIITAAVIFTSCGDKSDIPTDTSQHDQGRDVGVLPDMGDENSRPDEPDEDGPCTSTDDCPRGQQCNPVNQCATSIGCGALWNDATARETGCWYGHGEDLPGRFGNYGPIECHTDDECQGNEYGPYCVHQMCHPDPPCEMDDDCPSGMKCFREIICASPERLDGM